MAHELTKTTEKKQVDPTNIEEAFLTEEEAQWIEEMRVDFDNELQTKLKEKVLPEPEGLATELEGNSELAEVYQEYLKFKETAGRDRLTFLENRRGLFQKGTDMFQQVERAAEEGEQGQITVMSMDIDYFKAYNDISHGFGDLALQTVGFELMNATKDTGFSVRLGGEEIFLMVDKEIPEEELNKRAEALKNSIKEALKSLFSLLDEKKGQPGATQEFLEGKVLKESRNRKSFNEEMQKKQSFQQLMAEVKSEGLFEFSDDIEPADFVLRIKEEISKAYGSKKKRLEELKNRTGLDIGTITFGVAHVEVGESSLMNAEDLSEIMLYVEKHFGFGSDKAREIQDILETMTYQEAYEYLEQVAEESSGEGKETIQYLIEKNKKKRFGKIVDVANELAENQKKISRDSLGIRKISMAELDMADQKELDPNILGFYDQNQTILEGLLARKVKKAKDQGVALVPDNLAEGLAIVSQGANEEEKKLLKEVANDLVEVQRDRYYDSLTLTKNYEYLTTVIPQELAQADEKGYEYSMISFDIDNLKAVNDTWGHKLGDVVLMTVSRVLQEEMENIPEQLREKIEATGMEPSVIRATGGEEFIATFPGLTSQESREVFMELNRKVSFAVNQFAEKTVPEEYAIDKETGKRYVCYRDRIQDSIKKLDFQLEDGSKVKRSKREIVKFGTVTAGIVSLSEVREQIDENGRLNAGKMRQIADRIGETLKKQVNPEDGTSGRGQVWGMESYRLLEKLDEKEKQLAEEEAENNQLKKENNKLRKQLSELRAQLRGADKEEKLDQVRQRLNQL